MSDITQEVLGCRLAGVCGLFFVAFCPLFLRKVIIAARRKFFDGRGGAIWGGKVPLDRRRIAVG